MFMTFYNVDMEKAKNINDLLEEYERMEAIKTDIGLPKKWKPDDARRE